MAMLLFAGIINTYSAANLQQRDVITGKVTDESGFTSPGVTVIYKGVLGGSVTGVDGTYQIERN